MTQKDTIFFDLDGTLIDHFTTIHKSVAFAQRQLGLPESSYDKVRATVGGSVPVTLERLLGKAHVDEALVHFKAHFASIMFEDVFALPGADWLLEKLHARGYKLAVFTNKIQSHSEQTLAHLGLDRHLDAIIGTGELPYRKPEREFTEHALAKLGTTPANSILVGDSPFDYQTAANVGMDALLVTTGTHSHEQLAAETGATEIYPSLYELAANCFGLQRTETASS